MPYMKKLIEVALPLQKVTGATGRPKVMSTDSKR